MKSTLPTLTQLLYQVVGRRINCAVTRLFLDLVPWHLPAGKDRGGYLPRRSSDHLRRHCWRHRATGSLGIKDDLVKLVLPGSMSPPSGMETSYGGV